MAGRRINLSELADEPVLPDARVPAFTDTSPRSCRIDQLAPNPLNTRDVYANPAKITAIAESLRTHGQLQPCAVVTRAAFLAVFPEHAEQIGAAAYVQVNGGRRRAAAIEAGLATLDITVKDQLAESRSAFLAATAAENIDREDYDPIEEAHAVRLLVRECGSGKAAAAQLAKTPGWVSQRLALLKLIPDLQALVRAGEMPIRAARDIGARVPEEEQLAEWQRVKVEPAEFTAVNSAADGDGVGVAAAEGPATGGQPARRARSPFATAIRRVGASPPKIADALRAELTPEDLRALVELLLRSE